jgi:cell division protein FtsB
LKILIAVLFIILLGLQYRLWIGEGSFADINRLDDEVENQTQENTELMARNANLINEVQELQAGMDAVEEHARNELGLIQEGETFFLIVEDEGQSGRDTAAAPVNN